MALLSVKDESTQIFGQYRFLNSQICFVIGVLQMLVCVWGIAQHAHSFLVHNKVLLCNFVNGSLPLEGLDIIIYDVGLFHALWGIGGCVAEYLDGGFGRLAWCLSHQSFYAIGLLILLISSLPKILPLFVTGESLPIVAILVYFMGTTINFFMVYIYWHWYWHVSSLWESAIRIKFGTVVRNANKCSRRDKPMKAKELTEEEIHPTPHVWTTDQSGSSVPKILPPENEAIVETAFDSSITVHSQQLQAPTMQSSSRAYFDTVIMTPSSLSDVSSTSVPPPAPPVYATRLNPNSIENRYLQRQSALDTYRSQWYGSRRQKVVHKRILPPTPDLTPSGSIHGSFQQYTDNYY